ncbi:MAG: molybdopterin molybdotransferase MoeA [Campylobacteraceae bacterium]|jgi:molybdopterin molybdotransferase|nr:molybdopterin molybdotransferase MoeA [Campylobacteraceae bacterium]
MAGLNFEEAFEKLINAAKVKNEIKIVPLAQALGKVLAEDIISSRDLPPYNNSALDGYAVRYTERGTRLRINKTTIFAGVSLDACLGKDECYKIMTGAKIPADADTIVRFEDACVEGEFVNIPESLKQNDGFRAKGEECKKGELLVPKGAQINAAHIALFAAVGVACVKVKSSLKICVLSSGNELKEPYEHATPDQLYNINSYALIALLSSFGFEADYGGIIPDDLEKTTRFFHDIKEYDVIISSGGVSVGEADFVKEALKKNGFEAIFTSINLKPGKPTTCGTMGKTIVLSMAGNPLAAILNTFLFAIPCLKKIQGESDFEHKSMEAVNVESFKLKDARANVVMGRLENGKFYVTNKGKINSGEVLPLSKSNAISIVSAGTPLVEKGDIIKVYRIF